MVAQGPFEGNSDVIETYQDNITDILDEYPFLYVMRGSEQCCPGSI